MRKICVITGTRAEYGLLSTLMHEIQDDPDLKLQVVATGMHLSPEFGLTYQAIEHDGIPIDAKVEMLLSSDSPVSIAKSIGLGVIGFADAFSRLEPDLFVVLGDRFESFAAAQASMVARVPMAHLHGGETTQGAIDEAMRHAMTKMAHFHFVSTEMYRRRVIQLGEQPSRVFNVGAIGLDAIRRMELLSKSELESRLGFTFGSPTYLITYHPTTLDVGSAEKSIQALLQAFDLFPEAKLLFTEANADTEGRIINHRIREYVAEHRDRAAVFASLGHLNYLSALQYVDVVIGNSSSGLIEVPTFKKPTVNVGYRQQGRIRAESVIDCQEEVDSIASAIRMARTAEFQAIVDRVESPYDGGNTANRIKTRLKEANLDGILMKEFYDIAGLEKLIPK